MLYILQSIEKLAGICLVLVLFSVWNKQNLENVLPSMNTRPHPIWDISLSLISKFHGH